MAVGLAACQSAASGTGEQKESSADVWGQGGTGQKDRENGAPEGENVQEAEASQRQRDAPGTPAMGDGQEAEKGADGPGTVDRWQMVPEYGICKKGEPALYVLDMDASQMKTDADGVSARLLSAVYQDNVISVRVKLRDDTVTLIPDEKVKEILKQEEEKQKKQEQGIYTIWDDSYFCIDSDKNIYGHSAFRDRIRAEKKAQKEEGARAVTFDRINGKGMAGLGFAQQQNSISYKDNGKGGCYISEVSEKTIGKGRFTLDEPEGVYELWLDGFKEPMKIVFKRAPAYDSLEDIKGMVDHEGFYGMAEGRVEEDGLRLTTYTYSQDGYRIGFSRGKLMATLSDGRTTELVPVLEEQLTTSPEQGTVLEIPVSGERQPLDMVVEFRDCRIYLNGVSPMDELYQYGTDENGTPLTKHMAYIDARAEMRDADKNLYYVNAVQPEKGREGSSKDLLKTVYAMADMAGADKYNAGELAGFKAVYQEGESVIRLQLQRPSYGWNQEFVLPVQM
ncbi:hypothetical protein QMP26_21170 [Enterocloster clostridioformis]|nr:hypothetical protein [Enterocloster clostridioformis]